MRIFGYFIAIVSLFTLIACFQPSSEQRAIAGNKKPTLYYFGYSQKCLSCKRVEQITENFIRKNYIQQVDTEYIDINSDHHMIEKLDITEKAVYLVHNNKIERVCPKAINKVRNEPTLLEKELEETFKNVMG
jgi:hypothetical protein